MKKNKKSYNKILFRSIKKSFGRFMTILSIVGLGVGFFAGMMATTPDMQFTGDKYYDDTEMHDIHIQSTMGLTDGDADAVSAIEGAENVMSSYSADLLTINADGDTIVTKLISMDPEKVKTGDYLNQVILTSGRMPENEGECVIEKGSSILRNDYKEGDVLTISDENKDLEDKIPLKEFKIVGTVKSAYYFSIEHERSSVGSGTVQMILYTPESSFSYDVYTDIFLTVAGAKELSAFSDDYKDAVKTVTDRIDEITDGREQARYDEILADANEKINNAQKELDDKREEADSELEKARIKIEDGEKEVSDGEKRLEDGKKEYHDGIKKLSDAKKELADKKVEAEKKFSDADAEIAANKATLDDSYLQLMQAKDTIDSLRPFVQYNPEAAAQVQKYDAQLAEVNAGLAAISEKEAELEAQKQNYQEQIASAEKEIKTSEKKLDNAKKEIEDNEIKLTEAKQKLEDGKREYSEKKAEADEKLDDAQKKLNDEKAKLSDIEKPVWYVQDRESNAGFSSFRSNADKVSAIAKVFPIFFFLVAALVSLTTMTRMVEEERTQIGTLKALGYKNSTITMNYLLYAGIASVIGSIIGLLVGFKVLPTVIWQAYKIMYTLPPLQTQFNVKYAVISSLAAIICTSIATMEACHRSLKERPSALMLPKAPKSGKRIFLEHIKPVWKRMKFTHKVTARNLFLYKKRFFMTIIGVAGCTGLLLTGFGLHDSISGIVTKQFDELQKYNLTVGIKEEDAVNDEIISSILSDKSRISDFSRQYSETMTAENPGETTQSMSIDAVVPDSSEKFNDYMVFRNRITHETFSFDENSVIVTEKLASNLSIKAGDKITLTDGDGRKAELTVTAVTENYVYHYVYVSQKVFEEAFGKNVEFKLLTCKVPNATEQTRDEISKELLKDENVGGLSFSNTTSESFSETLNKINYIVIVLIFAAGMLAFIVLYNLTNINITERIRELATIKVLGFYNREVSSYIYRETAILSIIGTLFGLVFGIFLHAFVVKTAEIDIVMFGRNIYAMSYLYSALLTLVFSLAVNLLMSGKMKKINMVESLKAVD